MKEAIITYRETPYEDGGHMVDHWTELVRCKDCKYRGNNKKCIIAFVADKQDFPFFFYDNHGEWYCADGERSE